MTKDTSALPDSNPFKGDATINDAASTIARQLADVANTAGALSADWALPDGMKQDSLYTMLDSGMNLLLTQFQAWIGAPNVN